MWSGVEGIDEDFQILLFKRRSGRLQRWMDSQTLRTQDNCQAFLLLTFVCILRHRLNKNGNE